MSYTNQPAHGRLDRQRIKDVLMRWARIQLLFVSLLAAVLAGLLLDLITDALHISLLTTISVMCLVFAMVALQRTRAR